VSSVAHEGRARPAIAGRTLFDYADELQVEVATSCRRSGRCHECVVAVTEGLDALAPHSDAESFLRDPYRLACQAKVARDDRDIAFAPLRRRPKILTASLERPETELDPAVTRAGDEVRLDGRPIDRFRGRLLGLAIDLGTTTLVIDLVDLETGGVVGTASCANPQAFGGSDVMHRITYDGTHPGELQRSAAAALNGEIEALCRQLDLPRRAIYEVAVAGNATMRDLFFRLDVQPIGQRPYKSVVESAFRAGARPHTALEENAQRLGLKVHPKARAYGLPLIASHVGGDMAADLVATDIAFGSGETVMLVDIGTNTEVAILRGRRLLVASCPAGPAFEGGLVTYGMPGEEGAIERLRLAPDGHCAEHHTIGGSPPRGLCGSGLIDLLAELRRHGLMTAKGVFTADRRRQSMTVLPEHGITFSREDASHLAQAKAANTSGQWIVMRAFGAEPADIARLYLAGGFANYIDVGNAIAIGLLPPVPAARIVKVGNAAVEGVRRVLLSRRLRRALEERVKEAEHVELETTPDFFEIFVEGCQLKPMPERLGPAPAATLGPHLAGLAS
jgi:uncharacterized 2Fe-2S/4Fe-4S cluster protein (DUF4445 family)